MGRASVDERGFETVRRLRRAHGDIPLSIFKALVREQFNILLIDQNAALAAIPSMLPPDTQTRAAAFDVVKQALGARGALSADNRKRMDEVAQCSASKRFRRRLPILRSCRLPARTPRQKHHEGARA